MDLSDLQDLHEQVTVQLEELQQQLEEGRTALMQAAADKAALTAKLAAADRTKGTRILPAETYVAQNGMFACHLFGVWFSVGRLQCSTYNLAKPWLQPAWRLLAWVQGPHLHTA